MTAAAAAAAAAAAKSFIQPFSFLLFAFRTSQLANEKKYSSTNERRSQGGGGGKGGERADKNPSNDPKLYEFWWEEDINAQSLTQADPGKVVDDFHLRRKGGRLVVEGEEGEEEKDSDDNDGSGKGQTRER